MSAIKGWSIKRFDEFGTIYSGSTPSTTVRSFWDGDIVWVTPYDLSRINTPYLSDSAKRITEKGLSGCSATLLPPKSLVMSSRAPIGYVALPIVPFCTNQGCKTMKLREGYDPEFVYYNVLFNIDKVKNLGEGTTFAEISKAALSTVKLDFPESLSEQRKIAEILTTVDRAIEETEALVGKQQRIKTGLMQDLLTRGIDAHGQLRTEATHAFKDSPLGRIPVEWEAGTIGQYCNVQGGFAFPSSEYCVDGVGLIRISNIQKDSLTMSNAVSLPDKFGRSLPQFLTKPGDVLIAMSGATTGKTCRVTSENAPALINQRVGRFQIIKDEEIIIDFIYGIVTSDKFLSEVVIDSLGGAQPNVSPGEIESFSFPKPPVEEQRRIMEKLSFHDIQSRKNSDALAKLRALKTALMQDLLTGRKRVPGLLGSGLQ